jgi:hypothetical protein
MLRTVLAFHAAGLSAPEIALLLAVSVQTVLALIDAAKEVRL